MFYTLFSFSQLNKIKNEILIPNLYSSINPVNFSGPGSNISYSANDFNGPIVIELSEWEGYDKNNNLTWKGTSFGFKIEFTIGIALPGEKENVKVYTELTFPVLDKNSETYNKLKNKPYNNEDE